MTKPWSIPLQLFILAVLAGGAYWSWTQREMLGEALANLQEHAAGAAKPAASNGQNSNGKQGAAKGRERPVPVIVGHVTEEADDNVISAIGTARARRAVTLYADAQGEVITLEVKGGERVEEDQTLATLFSTRTRLSIEIARKNLEDAGQSLKRAEFLKKRSVGSDAKVTDAEIARERAELQLKSAEEDMRDRRIDAPFAGVVGIPKIEVGDRVEPGTAVVTLDDRAELYAEFPVPEEFLARIALDQKVTVTTPSYPRRTFEGHIGYIDSRIDPTSRTVMVRAVVPNPEDILRPGMSFVIALPLPGKVYPAVPELSLQWHNGESYVWIADGEKVRRVTIEAVRRKNDIILVSGPLSPGDLVVVEGVQRLRDGKAVSYQPPDPPQGTPAAQRRTAGPATAGKG